MTKESSLGLVDYHSVQFYTKNLKKTVAWHTEQFGFVEMACSTPEWEEKQGMRSVVLRGSGGLGWIFSEPTRAASSAGRYLERHPDGISFLNFRVKNLERAAEFLAHRKAPFLYDIETIKSQNGGHWYETAVATPISDVGFRFIEEKNFDRFAPGYMWTNQKILNEPNVFGFNFGIDHVTSNASSMHSLTEFYRHCLGFEQYWGIEFHTAKYKPDASTGSGLESIVMWDQESGIKFATNQPLAPYFNNSQIQIYLEDNKGSGIQHLAMGTNDIINAVAKMRTKDVKFLEASDKYYQLLPARMEQMKIQKIKQPMHEVQKNNILLDGAEGRYLLQIFMKEQNVQLNDKQAGPFFYEIIQREGDESFGEGNFKALFDSIEKQQVIDSRQEMRERVDTM